MILPFKHSKEIQALSSQHHVSKLYVFGSVLSEHFSPKSDIDFLVKFSKVAPLEYFDNYMDFKENLEKLLARKVDLVEEQTVKNPILKQSIDRSKTILYDRGKNIKVVI